MVSIYVQNDLPLGHIFIDNYGFYLEYLSSKQLHIRMVYLLLNMANRCRYSLNKQLLQPCLFIVRASFIYVQNDPLNSTHLLS
jgi:hypothetical protein